MRLLRWPQSKTSSEAKSADRDGQTTRPTLINQRTGYAACIRFLTASCKFDGRIIIIIILTPDKRVAYFPSRNTDAVLCMNETFPTTCSQTQIINPWRTSHNPWKFVNYSITPWMYFTHHPRPTCSLTLLSVKHYASHKMYTNIPLNASTRQLQ